MIVTFLCSFNVLFMFLMVLHVCCRFKRLVMFLLSLRFLFFLWFWEVLRVPREVIFGTFLDKIEVFGEKVGPSFLHTFTAFWLDFQGPGPPGESKKREKTASENQSFFELKKRAPKTVFSDFRLHFEVIFGALFGDFGHVGAAYFREGVRDRFGTLFGSILEVFWTVFGSIFGIILEVFL